MLQIKAGYEVTKKIEELLVDGDLLLLLTEKNLQHDLGVDNAITRKRFRYYYSSFLMLLFLISLACLYYLFSLLLIFNIYCAKLQY